MNKQTQLQKLCLSKLNLNLMQTSKDMKTEQNQKTSKTKAKQYLMKMIM
jgi:hypothetical protein